jgi:hypothetical protein
MKSKSLPPSKEFDDDLLQRVMCFLNQQGHVSLRALELTVNRGEVRVRGRVPTFYIRQVALECIKHVAGVTRVVDLIDVASGTGQRATNADSTEQIDTASSLVQHRLDISDKKVAAKDGHFTQAVPRRVLASRKE